MCNWIHYPLTVENNLQYALGLIFYSRTKKTIKNHKWRHSLELSNVSSWKTSKVLFANTVAFKRAVHTPLTACCTRAGQSCRNSEDVIISFPGVKNLWRRSSDGRHCSKKGYKNFKYFLIPDVIYLFIYLFYKIITNKIDTFNTISINSIIFFIFWIYFVSFLFLFNNFTIQWMYILIVFLLPKVVRHQTCLRSLEGENLLPPLLNLEILKLRISGIKKFSGLMCSFKNMIKVKVTKIKKE